MSEEISAADTQLIENCLDKLIEHFDNVQLFTSRSDGTENGTASFCSGRGNWFARYGLVRSWIVKEDERTKDSAHQKE